MPPTAELEIDSLARTITEISSTVNDYLEVAVILEIIGYSDEWAKERGYPNLFALAKEVYEAIDRMRVEQPDTTLKAETTRLNVISLFFGGLFYNIGWMIFLTALFLGGVSLWAAVGMPPQVAISISLGVLTSFVLTGGIQQFFGWKIIYYKLQNNYPLVRFELKNAFILGVSILILATFILIVIGENLPPFSGVVWPLTVAYVFLIGAFRLSSIPIYAYRKVSFILIVTLSTLLALFFTYHLLLNFGAPRVSAVIYSQITALVTATIVANISTVKLVFGERENRSRNNDDVPPFYSRPIPPKKVSPPRLRVQFFDGWCYFLYGFMYFAFLFSNRIAFWLIGEAYNIPHHTGTDLALLILIPLSGAKFIHMTRLSDKIRVKLENTPVLSLKEELSMELKRFYRLLARTVLLTALIAGILMLLFGNWLLQRIGAAEESVIVFRWALLANLLFGIYAMNAIFSFSLRRGKEVTIILVIGTILALATNYLLITFLQWHGVFGYLIAALMMSVVSTIYVVRGILNDADYVYFSAF